MTAASTSRPGGHVRGFTLVEVMITVAIVAILAAIAYPSYRDQVMKGRRAEGRAALMNLMQQQERFMTQTGSYAALTAGEAGRPFKTYSGDSLNQAAYRLGAESCEGGVPLTTCVRVFAQPSFNDPEAGRLTLTSTGIRGCTGSRTETCWR